MLVDTDIGENFLLNVIFGTEVLKLEKGIYQIPHFNLDLVIPCKSTWPEIEGMCAPYGVCDNPAQILNAFPAIVNSEKPYAIGLTKVYREDQPERYGWRWSKWGPYIGEKNPTRAYLYDEKDIEFIYCYHVYEVFPEKL